MAPRSSQPQDSPASRPTLPFEGFGPEDFELLARAEEPLPEPGSGGRWDVLRDWGGRVWPRLAWLGLAAVLSLGSAGVVAAMSPLGTERPAELTYGADLALKPDWTPAATDLAALNGQVIGLGDQTRQLLGSLSRVDKPGLEAAYASAAPRR